MIGTKLVRRIDGATFTITGEYGGQAVINPDDFGSSFMEPLSALSETYDVQDGDLPTELPPTEIEALRAQDEAANRALNGTYARALLARRPRESEGNYEPPAGSPEAIFRDLEDEA